MKKIQAIARQRWAGLLLLVLALLTGGWLGNQFRPEKFPLTGSLTILESGAPAGLSMVGTYQVEWDHISGGQLRVRTAGGRLLWQTIPGEPFVLAARAQETVRESRGMFNLRDKRQLLCTRQTVDLLLEPEPGREVTLSGHLYCSDGSSVLYNLDLKSLVNQPGLAMTVWLQDANSFDQDVHVNRLFLTYSSDHDEHYFGFGEQFTYFDMSGKKVPVWTSEQGVGRGGQPITFAADLTNGGAGGTAFTTYAPIPFYMTEGMRAFALENTAYSVFDLRRTGKVQIEVWSPTVYATIFDGTSPAELITAYAAARAGNPRTSLPDWIYSGAIVGMQGGTSKVEQVYASLQQRQVPLAGFWLQDWVGQRTTSFGKQLWWNWELDTDRYPRWDQLTAALKAAGVRVLLYINPNLVDVSEKNNARRNLFQEALESGYLIRHADGSPYLLTNTSFQYSMVDLSNPQAVSWLEDVVRENLLGIGASGWMADFGDALPYDAVLSQVQAPVYHNRYPAEWAALNEHAIQSVPDQQAVFFMRAASNASLAHAPLFWAGDQLVDWSAEDGIKSAVTGLNTAGLSGMAFNHSDIGGYTTITSPIRNYHRSRELLYRWMELNAFTLLFRTHEGNQPDKNIQFYTDDESLDTFAYWAKVYAALFEYRKALVAEAISTGLPVVRHPFIHYPADTETWKITYQQFMLGPDFMIAPVTDPGANHVKIYLPEGEWVHLWSASTYTGKQYINISAPIGQPGVFYRADSVWGQKFAQDLKEDGLIK